MGYQKKEIYSGAVTEEMKGYYRQVLKLVNEDPEREGLLKTPERASKAMQFLTHGYDLSPETILKGCLLYTSPSPRDRG